MMFFSVDRFEGEYVVLVTDNGEVIREKMSDFSMAMREGDIFIIENETYVRCESEAEARKRFVRSWMKKHKNKES